MTHSTSSLLLRTAALAALAGAALAPAPAQAWWRGGVFIGVPPVVVAPPIYGYPAPYYYPPAYYPPAYYPPAYTAAPAYPQGQSYAQAQPQGQAQQQQQQPQMSQPDTPIGGTCYAGVYVCAAPAQTHVGTGCSCPGIGAPSYGVVQ
jgi:hypothetical protein